ncbi:MAG: metallophosphoesterase [Clostridia bacterium]|nr:metallophosphoesterase [Clostridia bacterium]
MSTYAISDLHGFSVKSFEALLEKAGFSDVDTLYVIGDVVDRNGDGGVELLLYIKEKANIRFILGNHENMLLNCLFLVAADEEPDPGTFTEEQAKHYDRSMRNGGRVTINSLRALYKKDPEKALELFDFLRAAPVYERIECAGRKFLLMHGGLRGFSKDRSLEDYPVHDLVWERPKLEDEYFDDVTTVFGHTPTLYYGDEHRGKVIVTKTWINIDVGAADMLPPALVRLDDLAVFYGEW